MTTTQCGALGAPSVMVPENIIPSADASAPLSRVFQKTSVLLPESFRGGCSFGPDPLKADQCLPMFRIGNLFDSHPARKSFFNLVISHCAQKALAYLRTSDP